MSFNSNPIKAVNMDAFYAEDGELLGLFGLITEGGQTDYVISQHGAKVIMQALTEFIEAAEGKREMTRITEQ